MESPTLHRNIFQRVLGICATKPPSNPNCWTFEDRTLTVNLSLAPELAQCNEAIRIEGKNLPERVLLIKGENGQYHAFENRCTHGKRRLDPIPETSQVQCCSIGKSIFDYDGKRLSGSAKDDIKTYPVEVQGDKILIIL